MKKLILWLIIIMVVCYGIGSGLLAIAGPFWHDWEEYATYQVDEQEQYEDIQDISITTVSSDILIIPTNTDVVSLHHHGKATSAEAAPSLKVDEMNNRLDVELDYNAWKLWDSADTVLEVRLPGNYSGELSLKAVSGKISLDSIVVTELYAETVSGRIKAQDVVGDTIAFKTTSGDVDASISGELDVKTVSGDAYVEISEMNNLKLEAVSGDFRLALPSDAAFALEFTTSSGDLENSFPIVLAESSQRKVKGTVGDGAHTVKLKTVSGDVDIKTT